MKLEASEIPTPDDERDHRHPCDAEPDIRHHDREYREYQRAEKRGNGIDVEVPKERVHRDHGDEARHRRVEERRSPVRQEQIGQEHQVEHLPARCSVDAAEEIGKPIGERARVLDVCREGHLDRRVPAEPVLAEHVRIFAEDDVVDVQGNGDGEKEQRRADRAGKRVRHAIESSRLGRGISGADAERGGSGRLGFEHRGHASVRVCSGGGSADTELSMITLGDSLRC
jgi:hypothetical protein